MAGTATPAPRPAELQPRVVALSWGMAIGSVSAVGAEAAVWAIAGPQLDEPDGYRIGPVLAVALLVSLPLLVALTAGVLLRFGRTAVRRRRENAAQALAITLFVVAGLTVLGAAFAIVVGLAAIVLLVPTGVALLIAATPPAQTHGPAGPGV